MRPSVTLRYYPLVKGGDSIPSSEAPAREWPPVDGPWAMAITAAAVLAFLLPLFIGLDRWDLRNDESIYSYAVQRILETGDWLTPRSIPTDFPFLEKPPLKFWIVAGAMALGVTPNDEFGMRVFDAAFGAAAFGYVLTFGWRLAGPLAGAIALLMLFSVNPIVFDHSIRSNNMEAALILAYAGGLYHFFRWSEVAGRRTRRVHASVTAGYFVLGFMTKFVAVVFLPVVALLWLLLRPGGLRRLGSTWSDWVWPAIGSVAAVSPWFVYQSLQAEGGFWEVIFGAHVYTRFTASLDPSHLAPWHFYFTTLWKELDYGQSLALGAGGLVLLGWRALRGHALAQLLLLWWLVPFGLISLGTSKLFHYAYPFLAPVGLGAGWLSVLAVRAVAHHGSAVGNRQIETLRAVQFVRARPRWRVGLLVVAITCVGLALWTLLTGQPLTVEVAGVRWFRNSQVIRPALIAMALLLVSGYVRNTMRMAAVALLLLILPIAVYQEKFQRLSSIDRPLGAMRDCMLGLQSSPDRSAGGMYIAAVGTVTHQYYYYFRQVGPWVTGPEAWESEVTRRLTDASGPVVLTETQWNTVRPSLAPADAPHLALPPDVKAVFVEREPGVLLMLPGAYAACEGTLVANGASPYPPNDAP
jgi:4-amino-4-deoxy-L-arabinose transferase-like glycosyltransferase